MTPYPDFALTSEHRNVSIFQYAKGEAFPWESFVQNIENDALDPCQVDMLHALNWLKRHISTYQVFDTIHEDYKERCAASRAWCHLYPRVPTNVQAHLAMMLNEAPKAMQDWIRQSPTMWHTALSQTWEIKEDVSLWTALFKALPAQMKDAPMKTASLDTALKLLTADVYHWIHTPGSNTSPSNQIYDALLAHALPPLRARLEPLRALYPDLGELPKASRLVSSLDGCPVSSSGARAILELCKQLASNLNDAVGKTMALSAEAPMELPANAFELQP